MAFPGGLELWRKSESMVKQEAVALMAEVRAMHMESRHVRYLNGWRKDVQWMEMASQYVSVVTALMEERQQMRLKTYNLAHDLHVQALTAELTKLMMEFRKMSDEYCALEQEQTRLHQMKILFQDRIKAQEEFLDSQVNEARRVLSLDGDDVPVFMAVVQEFVDTFSPH